jgi:hypothetical protein
MRKFYVAAAILASATVFRTSVVMSSGADTPRRSPAYYVAASGSFLPTPALDPAW